MKTIGILGSTGSIGTQTLKVIDAHPEQFQVGVLTCGHRTALLKAQIKTYRPAIAVTAEEQDALQLGRELAAEGVKTEVLFGQQGLCQAAAAEGCDMILNALLGISGLAPTMAAIEAGKDIALANKETLITGGALVMEAAARKGVRILPVDSEHSAIFQCLEGNQGRKIHRLLLTASGGPFRGYSLAALSRVTREQALHHPRWSMGQKITVDSATMMNKGFEVMEAAWLFDVPVEQIEILVHPQSIVHSMVEFSDRAVLAQLGLPDMAIPISLALSWPARLDREAESLNFFAEGANLTFEQPDRSVFTCINLAYTAAAEGGSCPVALNAANEVLVDLFLKGKIRLIDIQENLERVMAWHDRETQLTLAGVLEIDRQVRAYTYDMVRRLR